MLKHTKIHPQSLIAREQGRFGSGSSCIDDIHIIRIVVDMQNLNPPSIEVSLISTKLSITPTHLCCICKISQKFEVPSGVHQGCILAPTLFLLVIGEFLNGSLARERGRVQWTMSTSLKHLDYADYICLLPHRTIKLDKHQQAQTSQSGEPSLSSYLHEWAEHRKRSSSCISRKHCFCHTTPLDVLYYAGK